jgi:tetratricopeptide (TPR) repeat protein
MSRQDGIKAIAAELRQRAHDEDWTAWQLADAIHSVCGVNLLQAHRLARGWTLETAVRNLQAIHGARVTVQQLSGWENSSYKPSDDNRDRLCRLYATRPDRCGFGTDHTPEEELDRAAAGGETEIRERPGRLHMIRDDHGFDGVEVRRRTALRAALAGLTGSVLTPDATAALAKIRQSMQARLDTSTISITTLDDLEEVAAGYGYSYQTTPPMELLIDAVLDFDDVQSVLSRPQPLEFQRRLHRISAQLAGVAGIALVQSGQRHEARAWFNVAHLAADETGDRALRGWIVARQAVIPYYFGSPRTALALARKARAIAGAGLSSTSAWAPSLEARALARTGQVAEALSVIEQARKAFDRLPDSETDNTAYGYTDRQLRWHEGSVYTAVGHTDRAMETLDTAYDMYSPTERLDRALIRLDRATCLVLDGEVEEACRSAIDLLLNMPDQHRTGIVVERATQFAAAVRGSAIRSVGEFCEVLREVSATTQ